METRSYTYGDKRIIAEIKTTGESINRKHRMENHFYREYIVLTTKGDDIIRLKLYATNATHYACLWVHGGDNYTAGSGSAGGYGYHRASSAVNVAINAAGFQLSEYFGGCGDSAIESALKAIALTQGCRKPKIIIAHS